MIAAPSLVTREEDFKCVEGSEYDNGTNVYILILDYVPIPWYGRSITQYQEHIFLFFWGEKHTLCFFVGVKHENTVYFMC